MKAAYLLVLLVGVSVRGDEYHPRKIISPQVAPTNPVRNVMESSRTFWRNGAARVIQSKLDTEPNTNNAKNIIFFIGDGMSIPTVAAARMYLGKEENDLSFDTFPHYGLAKTYCVDMQTADSACTATAFLSGIKTNNRLLGLNANVLSRQCIHEEEDRVEGLLHWAQRVGKATGIVTTTRITHATPGAAYAHVAHREWEYNQAISSACRNNPDSNARDIAQQMVYNDVAKNLKVILGGGRGAFYNTTMRDPENAAGLRTDGRNLVDEWIEERNKQGRAEFVWHNQQLDEIDVEQTDYLLGLFESDHCMYHLDILNEKLQHQEPSLSEMTAKAIKMLQKEENGFVLFVESGRIDHAHHSNRIHRVLEETSEFSRTVDLARKMTDRADTLIVVSSDHSHVNTFSGYPDRGEHILGIPGFSRVDNLPYDTMGYANGPGRSATFANGARVNLRTVDLKNPLRRASTTVQLSSETHAADDVGVYASGPWSHLFTGSYEQNNLPLMMAYAAKIGPYQEREIPIIPWEKLRRKIF